MVGNLTGNTPESKATDFQFEFVFDGIGEEGIGVMLEFEIIHSRGKK